MYEDDNESFSSDLEEWGDALLRTASGHVLDHDGKGRLLVGSVSIIERFCPSVPSEWRVAAD